MSKKEQNKEQQEELNNQNVQEEQEATVETEGTEEAQPATEEDKVQELGEKLATLNDKYLRLYSEYENYRKRTNLEKADLLQLMQRVIEKDALLSQRTWDVQETSALGFTPMVLMAATPETVESAVSSPQILASTYFADRKKLLTLNRSNGGATLISSGTVITKWPRRSYPSPEAVEEILAQDPVEAVMQENAPKRMKLQGFLLYLFAVLLLL